MNADAPLLTHHAWHPLAGRMPMDARSVGEHRWPVGVPPES